ncbi:TetR/AcrR family transcriptional regulator [Aureibacillus halotolerans]|uniref:TetR family transcriptional regulator n=1 Tax=Aureibacillus halotolerans TaxID=1508390 RepID=A0A4R6TRC1_9BACI|nr:TetR/AcrR family transcriptional regulator [Aureibacillus halotolerans]TDQ36108.1 TetR family transcriptional regulator [Aureibacillus halotolerans]
MNDKKRQIIDAAIELFGQKGYHATSMQDIAMKSGVSKGGLYLHFSSKKALNLALFNDYIDAVKQSLAEIVQDTGLSEREQFEAQLAVIFDKVRENNQFIFFHASDCVRLHDVQPGLFQLLEETRIDLMESQVASIKALFPEDAHPYAYDLGMMLEGLILSYMKDYLLESVNIDSLTLAQYLLRRIEDIVKGLIQQNENVLFHHDLFQKQKRSPAINALRELEEELGECTLTEDQCQDVKVAINVIQHELQKTVPQRVVLQGMLSILNDIEQLFPYKEKILHAFDELTQQSKERKT